MENKNITLEFEEKSALELIQQIKDGTINPKLLDKNSRQICLEALIFEGYGRSQISQILKHSEKTIQRDLQEIRTRNKLNPSDEFAKETIGDAVKKASAHHDYLIRISRGKDVSDADKIHAVTSAWSIMSDLIEKLQGMGYLPSRPTTIVGDIFYHKEDADTNSVLDDINKQIIDIEGMMTETNVITQAVKEEIKQVKSIVDEVNVAKDTNKEALNDNPNQ